MSETSNKLITDTETPAPAETPKEKKPVREKKEKKEKKLKDKNSPASALMNDERVPKMLGLVSLLSALFLFVAFVSYLFTWQEDQDLVFRFSIRILFAGNIEIHNQLGRLGAFVSHFFIYNAFGLASFIFLVLLGAVGINLLLGRSVFKTSTIAKNTVVGIAVFSVALSFASQLFHYNFQAGHFPLGGAFGNMITHYLIGFAGMAGTGVLLLFTVLAYMVIAFNFNFNPKPKAVNELLQNAEEELPNPLKLEIENVHQEIPLAPVVEMEKEEPDFLITEKDVEEPLEVPNEFDEEPTTEFEDAAHFETTETPVSDLTLDVEPINTETEEIEGITSDDIKREPYDPKLDLSGYEYPPLDLLEMYGSGQIKIDQEELERNKEQIIRTLQNYGIDIQKIKATVGPTVTLYEIIPAPGVRISKIKNLEDDIALSLSALGIRIIAPIPGKGTIGIEVPNVNKEVVSMRTLLSSEKFMNSQMELPVALGKTISNEIFIEDLAKMPHLLVAGATGQGKSVGINALLVSLLYKKHPSQIKFVLIDPKKVELSLYTQIEKHFLAKLPGEAEPIIVDTKKVINTLQSLCIEMDTRYDLLKEAQCRNIKEYNDKFIARRLNPTKGHHYLPYIVLVIDEFADLIMTAGKEVEMPIARLAQLARAIGIHLIIATQRPSVNIITGTIKANFPARIGFKVTSKIDSRTILDAGGAEQLIGRGDMLLSIGGNMIRLQCPFVDTPEVEKITEFISNQRGYSDAFLLPEVKEENEGGGDNDYFDPNERDELFDEAASIIVQHQQGSTSLLQRRLKLGYNRAGRLMDQLEAAGVVGPNQGSKAREVLIKDGFHLEQFLKNSGNE